MQITPSTCLLENKNDDTTWNDLHFASDPKSKNVLM